MKKVKIKNIATIRFGLNIKTNDRSGVLCLQGKDISENNIGFTGNIYVEPAICSEKDMLKHGQVLFSAKGNRHIAAIWNNQKEAVASSTFMILTVNKQQVLPEYLTWYINQPKTQNHIKKVKKGGTVSVVSKKEFEDIDVDIPSIEVQEKIIKIVNLECREQQLMNAIKMKRKQLIQGITNNIFK